MKDFFPIVTWIILFLNIAVFVFSFENPFVLLKSFINYNIHPKDIIYLYSLYPNLIIEKPYTLITHMFIHSDWIHLVVNMLILIGVGITLEEKIGSLNFSLVYFFSGLFSVLFNFLLRIVLNLPNVASMGSSGAIFGILFLGAILLPEKKVSILFVPILNLLSPYVYFLKFKLEVNLAITMIFYIIFSILMILLGFTSLSEICHLGGMFGGMIYFLFLGKEKKET